MSLWNQCVYCGKLVAIQEFTRGLANRELITPDSEYTSEEFETYHVACHEEAAGQ